jgi:hypothetical protein
MRSKKDNKGRNNINKKDHQLKEKASENISDSSTKQSYQDIDKIVPL